MSDVIELPIVGEAEQIPAYAQPGDAGADLRSAEALRGDPSASVAEIAASCGFDSPSNFSRLFRRYYGCTPRAYRALPAPRRPAAALSRCGRADIPESV